MSISFENHLLGALKCAQYRDDLLVLGLCSVTVYASAEHTVLMNSILP